MKELSTKNLDHHGIVAAIGNQLKISEKIDKRLPIQNREKNISRGQSVMAMVLNGLGFTERRLYMVSDFFQHLPVEKLLGKGVTSDKLNDDNLGRTLDDIHKYGTSKLFSEIAFEIGIEHNALSKSSHLDTTSINVEGNYGQCSPENESTINITHGYSKDHRPDLKQLVLSLTTTGDSSFPIWLETLSGNSSDKENFITTIASVKKFQEELKKNESFMWVADSCLYTKNGLLSQGSEVSWLTRVPETIKEAKEIVFKNSDAYNWTEASEGYLRTPLESNYGDVTQRWFLFFSQQAYKKEIKTFEKDLEKKINSLTKKIKSLGKTVYNCTEDAAREFEKFCKINNLFNFKYTFKEIYTSISDKKGRPKKADRKISGYSLEITYEGKNEFEIRKKRNSKGRFILATNELNKKELPDEVILSEYKKQSKTENSFRFLKDPSFLVSDIYLKRPERIEALAVIMGLSLMIYNVGQYHLRKILEKQNASVPNQVGKETKTPTLKWIFQYFRGIGMVEINLGRTIKTVVTNLTEVHNKIISFFGRFAIEIYGLNIKTPTSQVTTDKLLMS